ncbi:MAG: hypothetical protein R3307_01635 [Anaerolineales bacterium]|nr:hypothetical protein [Anaerolineales bacterium]
MHHPLFTAHALFDNAWQDYFAIFVAILFAVLLIKLRNESKDITTYNAHLAWLRAGVYFTVCLLISWATGVFKTLTRSAWITSENISSPTWIGFSLLCIIVVTVGYGVIWRAGTLSHRRPLHFWTVVCFGVIWGLSEGQLYLTFWAIPEKFGLSVIWNAIIAFTLISIFNQLWHSKYWDIHVAPEHNILEWNMKKVFFAHIPNLVCCIAYLAITGSAGMFVLFQTWALVLSTYFMRFPHFSEQHHS